MIFDALKIFSDISYEKNACPSGLISAFSLVGLPIVAKIRLNIIAPREKNRTVEPETLLRCPGNWDQRQLRTETELIDIQHTGMKM